MDFYPGLPIRRIRRAVPQQKFELAAATLCVAGQDCTVMVRCSLILRSGLKVVEAAVRGNVQLPAVLLQALSA